MRSLVQTLSSCVLVWMLLTTHCHAQTQSQSVGLCIDDRDCKGTEEDLPGVCRQGVCVARGVIECPKLVEQAGGEEVLVSHLRPVTISPPESTCGQDRDNNVIGINYRSSDPTTIYNNYNAFQNFDNLDDPGQDFGSGRPPSGIEIDGPPPIGEEIPIYEEDFIPQNCGVEETICPERYPRDQMLKVHLADRQVIGGPQCPPTEMSPRKKRQVQNATEPLCKLQIDGAYTGDSTFAFKMLLGSVQASIRSFLPGGNTFRLETPGKRVVAGFLNSQEFIDISVPRAGVWYHIALQFGLTVTGNVARFWFSIFLDGVYRGSIRSANVEANIEWSVLPIIFRGPVGALHIEDVRFYNSILTNREIYEVFSGEFTKLDIFSDCLCPASHPRALVDTAGLDLYCSLNEDENNRVRRDNPPQGRAPFTTNAGLYIPQFLTDGGALPFEGSAIPPPPAYAVWVSSPGVDPVIITVDLRETTEVSRIRLISITPPPEDHITLSAGRRGQWIPFFMFLGANGLERESTVPSLPFPWYTFAFYGPPYISQWSYNMSGSGVDSPITADSIRIVIKGPPVWGNFIEPQRKRRQAISPQWIEYHALSEIQVFGKSPGCTCYSAGAAEGGTCESSGRCECRSDLDPLAGDECGPYVSSISPLFGPESGGTVITIQGQLLLEVQSVVIGNQSCIIRRRSATHITCRVDSSPYPLADQPQNGYDIRIIHACIAVLGPAYRFQYRPDPVVQTISPRRSFLNGGIIQTISGMHLDSVASPYILAYVFDTRQTGRQKRQADTYDYFLVEIDDTLPDVQNNDGLYTILTALCEPVSPTEMHCPIPPVPPPEGFPFSQSPSDVDQPQVFDVDVYIGFWLDGVEQYRDMRDVDPDGAQILIYYNPELDDFSEPQRIRAFKPYPPHNHESIEIVGQKMQSGCDMGDYKVTVGSAECSVYYLDSSTMHCRAPKNEPQDAVSIHGAPRVRVTVGFLYQQHTVGYLEYHSLWQSTEFYIGIGVAIAVIIIIIIVAVICYKARH